MFTKFRTFGSAEFYRIGPAHEVPTSFAATRLRKISFALALIAVPKVAAADGPLKLLCSSIETLAAKVLPRPQCRPRLQLGARRQIFLLWHRTNYVGAQGSLPERLRARFVAEDRVHGHRIQIIRLRGRQGRGEFRDARFWNGWSMQFIPPYLQGPKRTPANHS